MWKRLSQFVERYEVVWFILLAVGILRIPNFFEPYWYGDEGIYLAVGHGLRAGLKLYQEIIDHKTPLIYWIAAASGSLVWFRVWLLLASLAGVGLYYSLCRRFMSIWPATVIASVFALLTTLPWFEGNIANGEILLMPFILFGFWLFFRNFPLKVHQVAIMRRFYAKTPWWHPVVIGIAFALAMLLKVPAGFDFAALGIFFLFYVPHQWRRATFWPMFRYGLLLVVGFLLPVVLSIGYFYLRGSLAAYFDFGLLYNFRYIQAWGSPFKHPIAVFLSTMKGRVMLLALYLIGLWLLKRFLSLPFRFIGVWFGLTLFASLLSLRPYPHYFIQVLPALVLLLSSFFAKQKVAIAISLTSLVGVGVILLGLKFYPYRTQAYYTQFGKYIAGQLPQNEYYAWFDGKTAQTYAVSSWLKERTQKYERVFILGDEPMIYALSERLPVGRFTVMFHVASFNAWGETLQAITETKPRYILVFPDGYDFPELRDLVDRDYLFVQKVHNADIYRLI